MPPFDQLTDVPGFRVGHWTNLDAATGCTVIACPPETVGGVDVRGAAPGTRETDLLRPGNLVNEVHAILLSGGSAFGLDAASGVMEVLAEQGVGLCFHDQIVPIVPAAILFDLGLGRIGYPNHAAGRAAYEAATPDRFQTGTIGAGTGATVAKLRGLDHAIKGGIGSASEHLDNGVVVAAIAAVNAAGVIRDPGTGKLVAGPRDDERGFVDVDALLRVAKLPPEQPDATDDEEPPEDAAAIPEPEAAELPTNTTLAVVATNAKLTKTQVNRVATVAHDGFASAIWPVHTRGDGDVVFALASGPIEVDHAGYRAVEAFAARAVERAILDAVRSATTLADIPSAAEWMAR
jgi:L-aminopeptidase/D-esterase-like protein